MQNIKIKYISKCMNVLNKGKGRLPLQDRLV